ncbi:MAG: type II secretion system protein [Patescibacteria group bacterium]|nr:type II secretion system protein [Patescibacteria group bacterium]
MFKINKNQKITFIISKRGFTLIEMLVVVAIIGVLSSVLLTALGPARDKAKDARIIQEINQVRAILESIGNNGNYSLIPEVSGGDGSTVDNSDLKVLVKDIYALGGDLYIRKTMSGRGFLTYSKLNIKLSTDESPVTNYFCADSSGRVSYTTTEPTSGDRCTL